MKVLLILIVFCGLFSTGVSAVHGNKSDRRSKPSIANRTTRSAGTSSFAEVLQAHNVQGPQSVWAFAGQAVRLTSYQAPGTSTPRFFERAVTVATDGVGLKIHTIDPMGLVEQYTVFDGASLRRYTVQAGRITGNPAGNSDLAAAKLYVATFGLTPILKRLASLEIEPVRLPSSGSGDEFQVVTPAGSWNVYVDARHLIKRLEFGEEAIDYSDYHLVNGVNLPFFQRVWRGSNLMYELVFDKIELNPALGSAYFTSSTAK